MKKRILFPTSLLWLVFASGLCHAGGAESRIFKLIYEPNRTYLTATKAEMTGMVTIISKDAEMMKQTHGIDLSVPTEMNEYSHQETTMRTGPMDKKGRLPFTTEITSAASSGTLGGLYRKNDAHDPIQGATIAGYFTPGIEQMVVTKVKGEGITRDIENALKGAMKQWGMPVAFPRKPLKIGDTFAQDMQVALPISAWKAADVGGTVRYELVSIEGDIAEFWTTGYVDIKGGPLSASGSGKGRMVFDLGKGQPQQSIMDSMDINIEVKADDGHMTMHMKATGTIIYSIAPEEPAQRP